MVRLQTVLTGKLCAADGSNAALPDIGISAAWATCRPQAEVGRHPPILQSIIGLTAPRGQELAVCCLGVSEKAISDIAQGKAGAIIVERDGLFVEQRRQIAELAAKNRLLTISNNREYVDAGALMSYGPDVTDQFRRAAGYVEAVGGWIKQAGLKADSYLFPSRVRASPHRHRWQSFDDWPIPYPTSVCRMGVTLRGGHVFKIKAQGKATPRLAGKSMSSESTSR